MTTVKKLVFCGTCALVLLSITPKIESGLKSEVSDLKIFDPLVKAGAAITKVFAGGYLLYYSIKTVEDMDPKHKASSIVYAVVGCVGGAPLVAWCIRDIWVDFFKKKDAKKDK